MADTESLLRIATRLNGIDERVRMLETFGHRTQTIAPYWSLGVARAFWSMGSVGYAAAAQVPDLSGGGNALDNVNVATFGNENAAPYVEFNGTTQYLQRADGGVGNWADITGTETYVTAAERGLTLGGWFRPGRTTNAEVLTGKDTGAAAASAYRLEFRGDLANDPVRMVVSTGAAYAAAAANSGATADEWMFCVGRYNPGAEIKAYVGIGNANPLVTGTLAAGIPAALPDVAANFTVGSRSGGGNYFQGRASYCFLCACMLSDTMIQAIYSQTRALFGV